MAPQVRELPPPDDTKMYLVLVKQVLEDYKSCGDSAAREETLQSLVSIYLNSPAKIPARRVLASFFQNLTAESQLYVERSICEQLSCRLYVDVTVEGSLGVTRHTVDSIATLMENFQLGEHCLSLVALKVIKFLAEAEEHFLSQVQDDVPPVRLNELMHHCLVSVQTLSLVLQKIVVTSAHLTSQVAADSQILAGIMDFNLRILTNEMFLLDCRCCCAMNAFLLLQLSLSDQEAAVKIPQIILPGKSSNRSLVPWLTEAQNKSLNIEAVSTLSSLAVVFGYVAAVSSGSIIRERPEGSFFYIDSILPFLMKQGIRCIDTMSKALLGKTVHLWTSRLADTVQSASCPAVFTAKCLGTSSFLYMLLEYVWTHSDDQLDVVRQSCKSVFENILKIHSLVALNNSDSTSPDEFVEFIIQHLFSMSWTSRGKFSALTCLVRLIGAEVVIRHRPGLPVEILSQLQEQALSCYASELYTTLLTSHRQELLHSKQGEAERWSILETAWVEPVIRALCNANKKMKQNLIEYLLCKLLKSDDQLLGLMMRRLTSHSVEPYPGVIIMCLRRAQVLGLLRTAITSACDRNLWYGHLQSDMLKSALCSSDEQIRLDAFALLCDNYKTTEIVTDLEFSMLKFFIPSNLNNQSPSFRQSFLSLINKLLFRLKESLAAIRRRLKKEKQPGSSAESIALYQNFCWWLTKHMMENLYPGSAFAKRTTSLAVLSLISTYFVTDDDGFNMPARLTKHHLQTLLESLADTFEENKREALKICTVYLANQASIWDKKGLEDIIRMSLTLACSTRPQDCSTAAYNLLLILKQLEYHPTAVDLTEIFATEEFLSAEMFNQRQKLTTPLMFLNILLSLLDSQISVADQSLIMAAANRPMYPTLHCIRYIMQEMVFKNLSLDMVPVAREFIQHLITSCLHLSRVVSPVVQNSSPEGNIPEAVLGPGLNMGNFLESSQSVSCEGEATDESANVDLSRALVESMPEYLVVCCWRSIKEVSLTLGNMCLQIPATQMADASTENTLLSLEQVKIIGEYFTTQLLESIHRGAFELAYAGFQLMCQMLWNHPLTSFHQLPAQWLSDVISSIKSDNPDSKLCSTRRSAGVPFFVQAVSSTEPAAAGRKCFHAVMKELLGLALSPPETGGEQRRLKSTHAQVHSLNILRALYRDARLGEEVVPYVADGLKASILGFKSDQWAVQNSATLLLSALMTRMFGVKRSKDETNMSKKNCQTGRAFFHHYPSLYPFLLSELEEATADVGSKKRILIRPSLYPVLLVLGRLFPSTLEGSDTSLNLTAFIPFVIRCAASPVYKTRVIASRALQPLARRNQVLSICCQLLESIPEVKANENVLSSHVHGLLLQLHQLSKLIRGMAANIPTDVLSSILSSLNRRTWLMSNNNTCLATRQAALQLVDTMLDISETINQKVPGYIKDIDDLKSKFLSALLPSNRPSDNPWHPLFYDLEKTKARLCLKHLAAVSRVARGLMTCLDRHQTDDVHLPSQESCLSSQVVLMDILVKLLDSPLYEVRLEVLDVLLTFWRSSDLRNNHDSSWSKLHSITTSGDLEVCDCGTDTDGLRLGVDETALEELLPALFGHFLRMAFEAETHHECLQKVFCVLTTITSRDSHLSGRSSREVLEMLSQLQTRMETERKIEVKAAMLRFSGRLVALVYRNMLLPGNTTDSQELMSLTRWIQLVNYSCSTDENPELQISCCQVLQENAQILFRDPDHKLGNALFVTWDSLAILLQEDDLEVKDTAAAVLCLVLELGPGSYHPSYALHRLPAVLVYLHGDRDLPGVVSCLLRWILCDDSLDTKDSSERLFDKGEMNVYRDSVAFTRSIALTLSGLFQLDLHNCNLGIAVDMAIEAVPDTSQAYPQLMSDKNIAICAENEHFSTFLLQAVLSLTRDLDLLANSCQRTDVCMNSARYMSLCQTAYKANVVLFLFQQQVCFYSQDFQQIFRHLESLVSTITGQFQLCNTLVK